MKRLMSSVQKRPGLRYTFTCSNSTYKCVHKAEKWRVVSGPGAPLSAFSSTGECGGYSRIAEGVHWIVAENLNGRLKAT
jgi:hypothetical protein